MYAVARSSCQTSNLGRRCLRETIGVINENLSLDLVAVLPGYVHEDEPRRVPKLRDQYREMRVRHKLDLGQMDEAELYQAVRELLRHTPVGSSQRDRAKKSSGTGPLKARD